MGSQFETTRHRKIVVNADDFGGSRLTNEAILRAFEKGLISSATIMANMPAFEEACQLAERHHLQHRIGLHLNLTEGKPLTANIADCPRFCRAGNYYRRPPMRLVSVTRKEALALEEEIVAQVMACRLRGITLTHLDSHHHVHNELGIAPLIIRIAKTHGINAVRLGRNCGPVRAGASRAHRMLAHAYRHMRNIYLVSNGLARTKYFGDARDVADVLQTTAADVEVMVHPRLDNCGRLVDLDGHDLESRITALSIPAAETCSYYGL